MTSTLWDRGVENIPLVLTIIVEMKIFSLRDGVYFRHLGMIGHHNRGEDEGVEVVNDPHPTPQLLHGMG